MANTYSSLHIHLVFAVKNKYCLIPQKFQKRIFSYMSGIINNQGHKTYIVNGIANHVHILFGLNPKQSISDLVREIKKNTTNHINKNMKLTDRFAWQTGFGSFSFSKNQVEAVFRYISKQEEHHKKVTFQEEYLNMLQKLEIEFDEKFLFDFDAIE